MYAGKWADKVFAKTGLLTIFAVFGLQLCLYRDLYLIPCIQLLFELFRVVERPLTLKLCLLGPILGGKIDRQN